LGYSGKILKARIKANIKERTRTNKPGPKNKDYKKSENNRIRPKKFFLGQY